MRKQGFFITFEGIDGAGKSTQLQRVLQLLRAKGWPVMETREPGGTAIGDEIRTLLLSPSHNAMSPRTEALLYAASRAQHVAEVIVPRLEAGYIVLCDRFVDASIAYQGGGLALGEDAVASVNEFALCGLEPHLTFLFDLPIDIAKERLLKSRGQTQLDRIEQRDRAYFSRVQAVFHRLAQQSPDRVVMLDATRSKEALEQEIEAVVLKRLS